MTKQEIIKRWQSSEGRIKLNNIINCFNSSKSLSNVPDIEKYNGRWDLRGAELSILEKEKRVKVTGHEFIRKSGSLKLKNTTLENIDFSYCNMNYTWIERCKMSNCIFKETRAKELYIVASDFDNCIFEKADLSFSFLNENVGSNSGTFVNVEFIGSNLKECSLCFPVIDNCIFDNCILYATNFNGSRFSSSKFIGEVNGPIFSGYPQRIHKSLFGIFNRVNPANFFNEMNYIDFSKSKMIGVSFINGIDISRCIFPHNENYILVTDIKKTFSEAKSIINKEWHSEEKRIANNLIDNIYFSKERQNQKMDLIDKFLLIDEGKMLDFGERFFNLIKSLN